MEIFCDGKAMRLARWPNTGWTEIVKVIDRGVAGRQSDRRMGARQRGTLNTRATRHRAGGSTGDLDERFLVSRLANETLKIGMIDTAKRWITSAGIHTYGIGNSLKWRTAKRRYYVFNLLEELDAPGEWYVDRKPHALFLSAGRRG